MTEDRRKPRAGDAVLGGESPPPIGGAVLGGLEGVKRRLAFDTISKKNCYKAEGKNSRTARLSLIPNHEDIIQNGMTLRK